MAIAALISEMADELRKARLELAEEKDAEVSEELIECEQMRDVYVKKFADIIKGVVNG
jgi:hypothetical protein